MDHAVTLPRPSTPIADPDYAKAVLDALASHICVLDQRGLIVAVNRAWRRFALENGAPPDYSDIGRNYLQVCQSSTDAEEAEASLFTRGVRAVLERRSAVFELEYPCHSPTERRWFLGRVTPLEVAGGGAVVSHLDITERKLVELELARLAATDPLTELPNRRFVMELVQGELERVQRFGGVAALVLLDLDRFKAVNDTYGHGVGDEALRAVARVCTAALRRSDVVGRLGGEEFLVCLPGADASAAVRIAEKLRAAVAGCALATDHGPLRLTASFGVAELLPSDRKVDDAMARADRALYTAKDLGRNRVVRARGGDRMAD
ncbi:MAG: sensor domain-containing diguanylate cyclase [Geminicoccaceae bacterium]|nr:MAG: sensor domain-containing diguanylate cyclase [Geminicoccaceae bacterium]